MARISDGIIKLSGDNSADIQKLASDVSNLKEELQYELSHIDETNMTSAYNKKVGSESGYTQIKQDEETLSLIAANEESIAEIDVEVDEIRSKVENAEGDISELIQTSQGILSRVSTAEGNISLISQTANEISTRVSNVEGDISTIEQTADKIATRVEDAESNISSIEQTATKIQSKVEDIDGNMSTITQTASVIENRVINTEGKVSTISQKADEIELRVGDDEEAFAELKLDYEGIKAKGIVTVTSLEDEDDTTTINGAEITCKNDGVTTFSLDDEGNLILRGSVTWGDAAAIVKVLYAKTALEKPDEDWSEYPLTPASSVDEWHKTFNSSSDKYASFNYRSGDADYWNEASLYQAGQGDPGYSSRIVYMYTKADSTPSKPTGGYIIYSFDDNEVTTNTLTPAGTWYSSVEDIPASLTGKYYFCITALAYNNSSTDTILYSEFASAQTCDSEGSTKSLNVTSLNLFRRSSTTLTDADKPSGALTYDFSTGNFTTESQAYLNGWTLAMPSSSNPCYEIHATASSVNMTDEIPVSEWSTPALFVKNGSAGDIQSSTAYYILNNVSSESSLTKPTTLEELEDYGWSTTRGSVSSSYPYLWQCYYQVYIDGTTKVTGFCLLNSYVAYTRQTIYNEILNKISSHTSATDPDGFYPYHYETVEGEQVLTEGPDSNGNYYLGIVASALKVGKISGDQIDANTITAGNIVAGTITATEIDVDTLTVSHLETTGEYSGNRASKTIVDDGFIAFILKNSTSGIDTDVGGLEAVYDRTSCEESLRLSSGDATLAIQSPVIDVLPPDDTDDCAISINEAFDISFRYLRSSNYYNSQVLDAYSTATVTAYVNDENISDNGCLHFDSDAVRKCGNTSVFTYTEVVNASTSSKTYSYITVEKPGFYEISAIARIAPTTAGQQPTLYIRKTNETDGTDGSIIARSSSAYFTSTTSLASVVIPPFISYFPSTGTSSTHKNIFLCISEGISKSYLSSGDLYVTYITIKYIGQGETSG